MNEIVTLPQLYSRDMTVAYQNKRLERVGGRDDQDNEPATIC